MQFKQILLIFVFLLVVGVVSAEQSYNQTGDRNTLFQREIALFNLNINPVDSPIEPQGVLDRENVPLVSDLDADGTQEIIIQDDLTIKAFQGRNLIFQASIDMDANAGDRWSNMITHDIDGDGLAEVIVASEIGRTIYILNYSDTLGFQEQAKFGFNDTARAFFGTGDANNGEVQLQCQGANRCAAMSPSSFQSGSRVMMAFMFNSTIADNPIQFDTTGGSSTYCAPGIRAPAAKDYDDDTSTEFIFTWMEISSTNFVDEILFVYYIDVQNNNTVVQDMTRITETAVNELIESTASPVSCDGTNIVSSTRVERYFSSPYVHEIDLTIVGLETVVAYNVDSDEFRLESYNRNGADISRYPKLAESEGEIISNIFRADVFNSAQENDFCVVGQEIVTDDDIVVLCGTQFPQGFQGSFSVNNVEFRVTNSFFNTSVLYRDSEILAHSIQTLTGNQNSEALTSFGVLELEETLLCQTINFANCQANMIYQNPRINGVTIAADVEKSGKEDLIVLTETNLFYIDDGFTNQPVFDFCQESGTVTGSCTQFSTDPCFDQIWKVNTTNKLTITPLDPEGDRVTVRAILYFGDSNEQDLGFINVSSGATQIFNYVANKTITNGIIRYDAKDVENQDTVRTIQKTFDVQANGVERTECVSNIVDGELTVAQADALADELATDVTDNAIKNGVVTIGQLFGVGGTLVWLIFMLSVALGFIVGGLNAGWNAETTVGGILLIEIILLVMGAVLEILSFGLLLIFVVMSIAVVSIFLLRFFNPTDSPG